MMQTQQLKMMMLVLVTALQWWCPILWTPIMAVHSTHHPLISSNLDQIPKLKISLSLPFQPDQEKLKTPKFESYISSNKTAEPSSSPAVSDSMTSPFIFSRGWGPSPVCSNVSRGLLCHIKLHHAFYFLRKALI